MAKHPHVLAFQRPPHGFQVGMKLEAVDKRNPMLIRVATISDTEDHRVKVYTLRHIHVTVTLVPKMSLTGELTLNGFNTERIQMSHSLLFCIYIMLNPQLTEFHVMSSSSILCL